MPNPNDGPLLDPEEIARLTAEFERAQSASSNPAGPAAEDQPIGDLPIDEGLIGDFPPGQAPNPSGPLEQPVAPPFTTTTASGPTASSGTPVSSVQFAPLNPTPAEGENTLDLLMDVQLHVSVELGRTRLAIKDLLSLAPGSVVELEKLAGEAVDVLVNGTLVAQGEVVVVDEKFGVRVTEVITPAKRAAAS